MGLLLELKKPSEVIGKFVKLSGSFWEGKLSAEEKSALFKCAVIQFSTVHMFANGHKQVFMNPHPTLLLFLLVIYWGNGYWPLCDTIGTFRRSDVLGLECRDPMSRSRTRDPISDS